MPRRSKQGELETIRATLVELLTNFKKELETPNLRAKVQALVPANHLLRDFGSSLISREDAASARDRILFYLRKYPRFVIAGDELMVVSGIGEWARRVRELRVQFGWWIYSGVTVADMVEDARITGNHAELTSLKSCLSIDPSKMKPDQYVLMRAEQDREAAHRWNVLNEIRKKKGVDAAPLASAQQVHPRVDVVRDRPRVLDGLAIHVEDPEAPVRTVEKLHRTEPRVGAGEEF